MKKIINKFTILFFSFILIASFECYGQDFGKNKVIRSRFDWLTYKTTHFVIYYYPEEERLVRTMAEAAELAYIKISTILEHEISKRTPLILYKSHGDFQQTNVILEPLGEGVGGFAELLKYRVVIPFTGSIDDFRKVITHEVTHIFQYDILYKNLLAHIYTGEFLRSPPLWFIEGLSEFMSEDWDAQGEMVLRDAVINNSIVPLSYLQDFGPLGSRVYLGYKEGQSAVQFLVDKYGIDKLPEILRELRDSRSKDMNSALKNTVGISMEEFDKEWQLEIKKRYWPQVANKQDPDSIGTNLTEKDKSSYYNSKPAWSPGGDMLAYITYRDGQEEIFIVSSKNGKVLSRITRDFYDYIREKGKGLAWSPDGDKIAFVGVKERKDYLIIVNVITNEIIKKIEMPFDAAYSPTWSPDNQQICLIGLKDGRSDVYIYQLKDAVVNQLTSDYYDDDSPSWNPSESKIVYSSERDGSYKLFIMDLNTKESQQITYGHQNDIRASWTPDGSRIVFCSDMNGIYDVYTIKPDGQELTRLTNIITGCFDPSFSTGNPPNLALTIYHKGKNDIYVLNSKELLNEKIPLSKPEDSQEPLYVVDDRSVRGIKYSFSFSPDIIYINLGYMTGGNFQNTIQFIGSDMMGDHRFMAGIDSISIQNQPNFFLGYYYLKRRYDIGTALFNWNEYFIEGEANYWRRITGLSGYLSYPMNRYNRVDLQLSRYYRSLEYIDNSDISDYDDYYVEKRTNKKELNSITSLNLALVKDNVIWSGFGPFTGMRYNLSLEKTLKLTKKDLDLTNTILDLRKYYKLGQRSNFAIRFIGAASLGDDKENFYLGSSFSQSQGSFSFSKTLMRGYEYKYLYGNRVGLVNLEIRIPFVDELRFGWPFTWGLSGIRGVAFMDFAGVWPRPPGATDIYNEPIIADRQFEPWIKDKEGLRLLDLRSSVGLGFRIGLGFISLSFDFAKTTDFREFGKGYKFHFGLGQEF